MKNEEVTQELINILQQKNVKSIAISKLVLSKEFLKHVGITAKSPISKKIESIKPFLGHSLEIVQMGKTNFLALKGSHQAWVQDYIKINPGSTSKQVAQALKPLKTSDIIKDLNALVISGSIRMELTDTHSVKLYSLIIKPPVREDRMLFKDAFEEVERGVDRGRISVRIYNIRRKLGWSRERFDTTLEKLRDEAIIQLHGGDIQTMKKDEIDDSYIDDNGFLHITIAWREK